MVKTNKFIAFILVFLSIFLISCGKKVEKIEESKFLFGTYIKIVVYSDNKEKAMNSIEKAFNEIQRIDEKYNSKMEGSLIYKLNTTDNKSIKLDAEGLELFKGVKKAIVEVRVSNMPAITVYEKAGFSTIDIRKNYYKNNGENAYVMIRDFSNERI